MPTNDPVAASETAISARRQIAFEPLGVFDVSFSSNSSGVQTGGQTEPLSALESRVAVLPQPPTASTSNTDTIQALRRSSRRLRRAHHKPAVQSEERFWLLHKWHGQVLSVGSDKFEAQLLDPSEPELIERATFQKTELSPSNIALLRPGATFYWFIGFRDFPNGQRKRESDIWMKRGGRMEQRKYDEELTAVKNIWRSIDWSISGSSSAKG